MSPTWGSNPGLWHCRQIVYRLGHQGSLSQYTHISNHHGNFHGGLVAKSLHTQCRGPGFDPWSRNWFPHVTTKSLHATAKIRWTEICCCSVTKLCLTLCHPTDCSMPGYPVHHHLPELPQTHVHWVDDAIHSSHPPSSPSPPALNFSQHQGKYKQEILKKIML